ncbi:hypothetical protein [Salinibacterium amurskyense]|nr:hypothetical protein [Salinibacterium amurskyense]RLQ80182.1 hypothetical protein D9C83_12325 [Salinibacterium amurskyense]
MAASDGPIDEMDASWASVGTLWEWTQSFISTEVAEAVPAEWRTDQSIGFGFVPELQFRRTQYIVQAWPSYIFEVLHRLDASTRLCLASAEGKDHVDYNELAFRSQSGSEPLFADLRRWAARAGTNSRNSDIHQFNAWFSTEFDDWHALAKGDPRGPSILAPLVERPLSDFDSLRNPPEFVSEPRVAPDESTPAVAQLEEDEFMVAPRDYDPDDLAAGQPLDSAVVHHALLEMDASLGGGGTITDPAVWLPAGHADLALGSVAGATVFVADGAVRGVGFEIGEITKKEWRVLAQQMRALARELGVHFAPDQDESWKANQ